MALKEEKVFVTSGKKKASVRKETDAVSVTRPKIVYKETEHTAATPSGLRPSNLNRDLPERGEEQEVLRGESVELSLLQPSSSGLTKR